MEDDTTLDLSRRRVLGVLASVGAASAGAGLGTSAFLQDSERMEGVVAAGELDLVVDFQEQYSGAVDPTTLDGVRPADPASPDLGADEVGVPTQQHPLVAVDTTVEGALDAYLRATAVDAFPDTDGRSLGDVDGDGDDEVGTGTADDGVQDTVPTNTAQGDASAECAYLQPLVPRDGDVLSAAARTNGTVGSGPNPQTTSPGDPLVAIEDVKPGDFGEVTFSLHLCGNPGYVVLRGELVDEQENGIESEAERRADPDGTASGELLENTQAVVWYDAGADGVFDDAEPEPTEGDNVLQAAEDVLGDETANTLLRGPLEEVLELLERGIPLDGRLAEGSDSTFQSVVPTASDEVIDSRSGFEEVRLASDDPELDDTRPRVEQLGYMEAALFEGGDENDDKELDAFETELDADSTDDDDLARTDDEGGSVEVATTAGEVIVHDVTTDEGEIDAVTISTEFPVTAVAAKGGTETRVWEEPGGAELDTVRFRAPESGNGGPSRPALSFLELGYDATTTDRTPEPFPNSTTAYIGFAWYVPPSVGNEIQGDSLSFDVGFAAEQASNNDDPSLF